MVVRKITTSRVQTMFDTLHFLGSETTSYASEHNQTFPFVNMPKFEVQGSYLRHQTGLLLTMFSPLVEDTKKGQWEKFAWENQGWLDESRGIFLASLKPSRTLGVSTRHQMLVRSRTTISKGRTAT